MGSHSAGRNRRSDIAFETTAQPVWWALCAILNTFWRPEGA